MSNLLHLFHNQGKGRPVGFGGATSNYLLRDDFTDTRAAGAVNNTPALPGPGTRDVTDTGSDLSILASDYLQITTGKNAWDDPVISWDETLTRGQGALMAVLRPGLTTIEAGAWLNAAAKPAAPGTSGYGIYWTGNSNDDYSLAMIGGAQAVIPLGVYARCNVDHIFVILPRPTAGALALVCVPHLGAWPTARLFWVDDTGADATLYAGLASYTTGAHVLLAKTVRFVKPGALPAAWLTQWGLATDYDTFTRADSTNIGSTEGGARAWTEVSGQWLIQTNQLVGNAAGNTFVTFDPGVADGWFEIDVTASNPFKAFIFLFRYADTDNYWAIYCEGSNMIIGKNAAASWSQPSSYPLIWAADATKRIRVRCSGTGIEAWCGGAYVSATDAFNQTATKIGLRGINAGLTGPYFDNVAVWPLTVTLPTAIDFPVDPPAATGAALETDAFTDADGTALATHNADWTIGAGTWEVRSNKAQQTAADATGHAVMDSGVVNHEAKVTIVMPAAPGAVNDWFPAVLVRYTDANNYVEARLLYQSNSPELEIWETIAGTPAIIGAVNLGAGNLDAGSSKTLRVAVVGQEVAAYIDDVLRLQCTTTLLTGTKCGIGTMAACEGQPTYDDWQIKAAA